MTTKIKAGVIETGAISTASLADTSITADKLHTTLDLTGKAVTVATATAGDNDTTVASTAFVSTAIANLTDSAPAALDTLNELAAALNDDADFSTTVTNSIATKLPLAGGTLTGDLNFGDSDKAVFGAGSDLQIYHDGSASYIDDAGTGNLRIRANSSLSIQKYTGETMGVFTADGSVLLAHDNNTKFETTATGIDVTGNIVVSGTVDGRDVATDGTKLDGIEANATADQTQSEINALGITATGLSGTPNITVGTISSGVHTITSSGTIGGAAVANGYLKITDNTHTMAFDTNEIHTTDNLYLLAEAGNIIFRDTGNGGVVLKNGVTQFMDASRNLTNIGTISSGAITSTGVIQGASFSDGTISGITFIDEDSFTTNSAIRVPTQQSIKAYVDTQVAGIVDSAPAALDTLNELAAALGDDANFSTTTSTALGNRLRVDINNQGLTGTQQANAITNLGITATKAELNFVDSVTSNIQTQLDGKQASGSYLTGNQTITLSGDVSGSGTTSIAVTVADDSHNHIISNVDGLQTALDAKLASSSYTAADVLTKIKTVDGAGSGLNADLLDGISSASFLRSDANDTFTGTLTTGELTIFSEHPVHTGYSGIANTEAWTTTTAQYMIISAGTDTYVNGDNVYIRAGNNLTTNELKVTTSGTTIGGNTVWHAGNDSSGSGLDADLLDGQHGSYYAAASHNHNGVYTPYDHFRSLGTQAFTGTATTAGYISEMESDGAFDSYSSAFKTSWSYAGNFNISDGGTFGPTETAGMSHFTWTDNSSDTARGNITVLAIAPNTGGSAGRTFIYNDQGSSYAPGWREIWTSRRMGAGTGLDADLLDGQHGSYYATASGLTTATATANAALPKAGGTMSGTLDLGTTSIAVDSDKGFVNSGSWTRNTTPYGYIALGPANSGHAHIYTDRTNFYFNKTVLYANSSNNLIWHAGNDGSGSGLDADTLDGYQLNTGRSNIANRVVATDGNGYIQAGWINTTSGVATGTPTRIYCSQDAYIRYYTPASLAPYILNQGSTKNAHTHPVSSITAGTFTGTFTMGTQLALVANGYGRGLFGVYSATRYQHVWSMGTAYKTSDDGTSYGNMYGLTWTHTNIGTGTNQSISGLGHQLQLRMNGTLHAAIGSGLWTSGNVTAYSDIAVKKNLVRIPNALEKVCSINGYTYERTDYVKDLKDPEAPDVLRQAGVVAQEIEKVLPEVVSGKEGNKAVAYGNIVALLIESIKQLKDEVDDLRQQLKER
jgi:hypothetical protein